MDSPEKNGSPASSQALPRVPQRSVLADEVYAILRDSLVSRRIEPSARLNLDQLARDLHVSNTPVRQALARLEADGLVTKEAYRGFAASPLLDSRAIAELYDYRLIVEPTLAARAARRRNQAAVLELEQLCDEREIARLVGDPAATEALGDRDLDFHCLIATEAGNQLIVENVRSTLNRMSRFSLYPRQGAGEPAWEEHRAVTEAIKAEDPEAAATAMRVHLTKGLERLSEAIGPVRI
jgi:DNA-binding GntR family transcriptional regulator